MVISQLPYRLFSKQKSIPDPGFVWNLQLTGNEYLDSSLKVSVRL